MFHVKAGDWSDDSKPVVLITGGVHGYEPAGIEAALHFLETSASQYTDRYNFLVYPCISPAAYETDIRWAFDPAIELYRDPNREFHNNTAMPEVRLFIDSLKATGRSFLFAIDLHETLDQEREKTTMQLQASMYGKTNLHIWENSPEEPYLYETCARAEDRLGPAIVAAIEKVTPVCKWEKISGDLNQGGVIYSEALTADSEYTGTVCTDSFLTSSGFTPQAITTETYAGNRPLDERVVIQMIAIKTALEEAAKRPGLALD